MRARAALGVVCVMVAFAALAAEPALPPPPTHWVTDVAGVLPEPLESQLDARLKAYERETGHQVVVWVGRTTGGMPLEEWAARTFHSWGVGRKGLDDGLAVFILMDDRRIRIEVGYGLEPVVTDARAASMIRDVAVPALERGRPDEAVTGLVDELLATIGGEKGAPPRPSSYVRDVGSPSPLWKLVPLVGFALFTLVVVVLANKFGGKTGRGGTWGGGGMWGGGSSGGGSSGGGGGGFSGGGGSSGGGGASGSW